MNVLRVGLSAVLLGLGLVMTFTTAAPAAEGKPIALHPENPHVFLFRGKPAVLVTSAEHYGALLNLDFDFVRYLDTLRADGFNLTRVFSGAYVEESTAFKIANNTLAPAAGRFICPWARSEQPGYAGGGNRFDLARWDPAYFRRLRELCRAAGERGIVVEYTFFCPFYNDRIWAVSPQKAENNVNGIGAVPRQEVYTLKHADLTALHEALVRKVVAELRDVDNLYYEICNEPYQGTVTAEWQARIARTIHEAEAGFSARHLIAQNIANGSKRVEQPNPLVSLFNFHYSAPPDSVRRNWDLNRPIGFDETGFKKTADAPYRMDGWDFMLAGGAVYNHLDYAFTTAHPDGTAPVMDPTPGGGGPTLRRQLAILKRFLESFDLVRLRPAPEVVKGGVPAGATARVLADPGRAYALYLRGGEQADLTLALPTGRYRAEWFNPRTGMIERVEERTHAGDTLTLSSPRYTEDMALRLRAAGGKS